jgi:hypothetical protein
MMTKYYTALVILFSLMSNGLQAQNWKELKLRKQIFELHNVTGSIERINGKKAIRIERDLDAIPFDLNNLQATVDEAHYAKLINLDDFENGIIEVELLSQLQNPLPYDGVAGFIGLYFRIAPDDSEFEGIYLRPKAAMSRDQWIRNHSVQYISYPNYKFDDLRKLKEFKYEGAAPIAMNEWIKMKLVINGKEATLYIDDIKHEVFSLEELLGENQKGSIGLYVDIGTIGYFRNLKVQKKALVKTSKGSTVKGI